MGVQTTFSSNIFLTNINYGFGTNYWAGAFGYPGYQFTGGNSRFGFSSTAGYVDVYTDGNFYAGIDLNGSNNLVLHAGNYNSYSPTLTGGNASGTWGINITGSAASASRAFYSLDSFTNSGAHGSSYIDNYLRAENNGAGTGAVYLRQWCSEPGVTWDWAGFGYNVANNGGSPSGFGRLNTNFGQAYMRFSTSGDWYFYNTNTSGTRYQSMQLTSSGNVIIQGTTTTVGFIYANNQQWEVGTTQYHGSNTAYNWRDWGGWGGYWWDRNGGDMIMNLYALYAVTGSISDMRYKKDIVALPYGLNEIMQLNPIKYHYNLPKESMLANDPDYFLGFSAQEVQGIIPEAVHEKIAEDSENMKGMLAITMDELIPVTVQAIKDQQAIINSQASRIDKLEALINQLINKLGDITTTTTTTII
jgi:hypothetical protein